MAKFSEDQIRDVFAPHLEEGETVQHMAFGVKQPNIFLIILLVALAILPGLPFAGDYCLTLDSDRGAAGSLIPTYTVESEDDAATETSVDEGEADRVTSPVRLPRLGTKRRPLPR